MSALPSRDVVIVGFGGAGGVLAAELARGGLSVVALERGPLRTTEGSFSRSLDSLRFRVRNELVPSSGELPLTFSSSVDQAARPVAHNHASLAGGSSVTWSAYAWRYYEDDFRLRSALRERYGRERLRYLEEDGAAIEDWPITYADLEPYYEKAEHVLGIGGWPGNLRGRIRPVNPDEGNPFEAPRQNDYPFRPLRDSPTSLTFREGALRLGLHPFHSPMAINSARYTSPYGITREACSYCGFCSWHPCWNGAKSSSLVSLLPAAQATGRFELRTWCHVLRLVHRANRATAVAYVDDRGREWLQPAEIIILAAYTYQNVRLLLHSGIHGGGLVGQFFINRAGPQIRAVFSDRTLNGYAGPTGQSQSVDDFNGENAAAEKLRLPAEEFFVRGGLLFCSAERHPVLCIRDIPPDVPRWGHAYKAFMRAHFNGSLAVAALTEGLPYHGNRIDLDPVHSDRYGIAAPRVRRALGRNEVRMARFMHRKAQDILRAAGATHVWGTETPTPVGSMNHDVGGCRMGRSPDRSVTNRFGQLWEVPNVFVAGGALFPSLSGHNPTQTMWALGFLTSDAILHGVVDLADASAFGRLPTH